MEVEAARISQEQNKEQLSSLSLLLCILAFSLQLDTKPSCTSMHREKKYSTPKIIDVPCETIHLRYRLYKVRLA